jgi:protein-S-isoprenylcysteine O-methyltransferase Ste14
MVFVGTLTMILLAAAGTWQFFLAWIFAGTLVGIFTAANIYLAVKDPALLEGRNAQNERGEPERVQQIIMRALRLCVFALVLTAGLDRRYGWSDVPLPLVAAAYAVLLAGALIIISVFRANTYGSSVIEVGAGQRVIATGPYAFVRHPMYLGALVQGAMMPLCLGSYWAEAFIVPSVALVIARLLAEERLLRTQLSGYAEYTQRTRHRLVPGVW